MLQPELHQPERDTRGHHRWSAATDRNPKRTLVGALRREPVIVQLGIAELGTSLAIGASGPAGALTVEARSGSYGLPCFHIA